MFVLCLPLFHVFFIWIHACMLDLGLCHVHIWFPFVNSYACIFGASLFVWLHPFPFYGLFRCYLLWEYISCILGFLMLSLLVPYNMFSFPLCMITCFVAFVHALLHLCLLCLLCAILFGFHCFFCILVTLFIYSCMWLCVLVFVIKPYSYLQSCVGSHSSLYMRF